MVARFSSGCFVCRGRPVAPPSSQKSKFPSTQTDANISVEAPPATALKKAAGWNSRKELVQRKRQAGLSFAFARPVKRKSPKCRAWIDGIDWQCREGKCRQLAKKRSRILESLIAAALGVMLNGKPVDRGNYLASQTSLRDVPTASRHHGSELRQLRAAPSAEAPARQPEGPFQTEASSTPIRHNRVPTLRYPCRTRSRSARITTNVTTLSSPRGRRLRRKPRRNPETLCSQREFQHAPSLHAEHQCSSGVRFIANKAPHE